MASRLRQIAFLLLMVFFSSASWASVLHLPNTLSEEALSETVPMAFSPNDLDLLDFKIHWARGMIPGVEFKLVPGTLQWVRVSEILVVPRARISVKVQDGESVQIFHSGFSQSVQVRNGQANGEVPIALISGEENPIRVAVKKSGKLEQAELWVEFQPRFRNGSSDHFVSLDSSCSAFGLSAQITGKKKESWAYLGCRLIRGREESRDTASLEVFVFWDHVGSIIEIEGIETRAQTPSVWILRLSSQARQIVLQSKDEKMEIQFRVPQYLNRGLLSLGLGPYFFGFQGEDKRVSSLAPLATLYGSYFFSEGFRLVGFGLWTFEAHQYADLGLYFYVESGRFLDRRISTHLLVGGHGLHFKALDQGYMSATFPQGFEVVYSDAFIPGNNLKLGAFIYPPISQASYYNCWLRWGAKKFIELNYIAWQVQPSENTPIFSASTLGLSVGFPLIQFW